MAFLVCTDNEEKFTIPVGNTVIGRGPYLRVKELSLSRSHAVVSLIDGKLSIKSTHKNPTYFYSSDDGENYDILEKDKWKELAHGDFISLMSDSLKYRIETISNDNPEEKRNVVGNGRDETSKENVKREECPPIEPLANKKRKLPVWMVDTPQKKNKQEQDSTSPSLPSSAKFTCVQGGSNEQNILDDDINKKAEKVPQIPQIETSPQHESCRIETSPQHKSCRIETSPQHKSCQIETSPQHESCFNIVIKPEKTVTQGEEAFATSNEDVVSEKEIPGSNKDVELDRDSLNSEQDIKEICRVKNLDDTVKSKEETNLEKVVHSPHSHLENHEKNIPDLEPCPYGRRCYRKNPDHFNQYSHPPNNEDQQDSRSADQQDRRSADQQDSRSADQQDCDDKPECPYGMKCYRNNPSHIDKFSHNLIGKKRTARTRKKNVDKKKGKKNNEDEESDGPNEYDLNDSFLTSSDDDDSIEASDDSDYRPPGGGGGGSDDDEEDLDELVSEAKGFIENTKM